MAESELVLDDPEMTDVYLAAPTAPEELKRMFLDACARPTDIHQHLTVLRDTGSGQKHITEMGVGTGQSTLAWLLVQPEKLVCYDLGWQDCIPTLQRVRGKTDLYFFLGSSLIVEIEETDLLFIDTSHSYLALKEELRQHAPKVRNYIVLHDTTTFADHGEDGSTPGLWQAVEEFCYDNPEWKVVHRHLHNNGLTILGRNKIGLATLCKTLSLDDYQHLRDETARIGHAQNVFAGIHRLDHQHRFWEYGICLAALGPRRDVWGKTCLDVGGGDSLLGGTLALGGADVTVNDTSNYAEHTEEMGRRANNPMKFIQGDFATAHGAQCYDAVFCVSVIEHIPDDMAFFRSLLCAVKPGGVLALTTDFDSSGGACIQGHERCYNAAMMGKLVDMAEPFGFTPVGELDYPDRGTPIFDRYNFSSLVLRRLA